MIASFLAVQPVNSPGGAILSFAFPMGLVIVITLILWGLFGRFRPPRIHGFQSAVAEAGLTSGSAAHAARSAQREPQAQQAEPRKTAPGES
jgi:hypothetical protein